MPNRTAREWSSRGLVANALNDDRSHAVAVDPVQKRREHEAGPLGEGRNGLALAIVAVPIPRRRWRQLTAY